MTTWLSKELALDLLAITVGYVQGVYERIRDEPDNPEWPQETIPPEKAPAPAAAPAPAQPAPVPSEPEQTESQPAVSYEELHPKAQALLRDINLAEGIGWISNTLFPHFGVNTLGDVPADKLPELIAMAEQHQEVA